VLDNSGKLDSEREAVIVPAGRVGRFTAPRFRSGCPGAGRPTIATGTVLDPVCRGG
jgi:hypothetical protein